MATLPTPLVAAPTPVRATVATAGRRRRPSGEPPPLPRRVDPSTGRFLVLTGVAVVLWVLLLVPRTAAAITWADLAVVHGAAHLRTPALTDAALALQTAATGWSVRVIAWSTIGVLLVFRRFHRLGVYLAVLLVGSLLASGLALVIGRMRPAGVVIEGHWDGYSHPSRAVAALALVLVGALYTLVPRGVWRNRGAWTAAALLALFAVAQVYLGVDHPTDLFAAFVLGWALPVVAYRLVIPDDVFPVSYRGGRRAHLDVGGRRGDAIRLALEQQLGLHVESVEPFGQESSAGSTPLRLRVRRADGGATVVLFAKLYALSHLRSDRWYKLARTVLYGRLEDEKPFSSVRRLVEYEDHLLRLFRDAGLPTPRPYGFAEITPDREYVIVMEFFDGAREIDHLELDDAAIDDGLRVVRRMWDAGLAHRDLKPSNVLLRDDRVLVIDVAFAAVRPTPWRQAVDLANMMLTLALSSSAERVWARALLLFAPEDLAEAFAASRSITIPTQLRARLRADERDLLGAFRRLAPPRAPVAIQLWSLRRVALTAGVVLAAAIALGLVMAYVRVAGLV